MIAVAGDESSAPASVERFTTVATAVGDEKSATAVAGAKTLLPSSYGKPVQPQPRTSFAVLIKAVGVRMATLDNLPLPLRNPRHDG